MAGRGGKRGSVAQERPIEESLREYGRGLAGGLIFSLPLLYTMEVWWAGFIARPERIVLYLLFTFALLLGYNRYAGMHHDANFTEVIIDSVEELGLGWITACAVLFLLGQLQGGMPLDEIIGKITIEGGIVAIGFSVGTAQLGGVAESETGMGDKNTSKEPRFLGQLVIAFCGAVLFAANVAPTEEILVIAVESTPARLLGLAVASLALGTLVLFYSNFLRAERYSKVETRWQVLAGSAITYAIALLASALTLWFFGRFHGYGLAISVGEIIVLGLPASLGASAGRLLLQP